MGSYEEERRRRVEENKKRMLELGILEAAKELTAHSKPAKPARRSPVLVLEELGPLRRSSRVSATQRVNYSEKADDSFTRIVRRSSRLSRVVSDCSEKARNGALRAAEKIQSRLEDSGSPSAIKSMLHSHVSGGFWLSLPLAFCRKHMPKKDTMMTLEDPQDQEWESLYLAYKNGLSGGWRGFSMDHDLQDGDALVFQLTEPTRLKVHVVRAADYENSTGSKTNAAADDDDNEEEKKFNTKTKQKKKPASKGPLKQLKDAGLLDTSSEEEDDYEEPEDDEEISPAKEKELEIIPVPDDLPKMLQNFAYLPVSKRTRASRKRLGAEIVAPGKRPRAAAAAG